MKAQRAAFSTSEAETRSQRIIQNIIDWPVFQNAEAILIYAPLPGEVDIFPLIKMFPKKRFALPRMIFKRSLEAVFTLDSDKLVRNKCGIFEPPSDRPAIDLKQIDLVLVPALAVDTQGNRLGFGQGYYDTFLQSYEQSLAAIVFDWQIIARVPTEAHDRKMNIVISESQLFFSENFA